MLQLAPAAPAAIEPATANPPAEPEDLGHGTNLPTAEPTGDVIKNPTV